MCLPKLVYVNFRGRFAGFCKLKTRGPMKQNITISVEKSLLQKARALAAQRGASISSMLAEELVRIVDRGTDFDQARRRALARLSTPFHLGGSSRAAREPLHDRNALR